MNIVIAVWGLLNGRQRRQLAALQVMSVFMAISTVCGIAAVLPFFTVLANPDSFRGSLLLRLAHDHLNVQSQHQFVVVLGVSFIAMTLVANVLNFVGVLAMNRFAHQVGDGFHVALFNEYLHRNYRFHSMTNSSLLVNKVIYQSARLTAGVLQHGLSFVTSSVTILFILASILAVNATVALCAIVGLGASYGVMYAVARGRLLRNGQIEGRCYEQRNRIAGESFGAIKEIVVSQAQPLFVQRFAASCASISHAVFGSLAIATSPRYILESVIVCTLVGVALYLSEGRDGSGPWIGQLSFFALAAYRLMPALQQVFASIAKVRSDRSAFESVAEDLRRCQGRVGVEQPVDTAWHGRPRQEIRFESVLFRHSSAATGAAAVADLSVRIEAGTTVGFVGANGSGKTTLVDLLTGLLAPQAGCILVDGVVLDESNRRSWQSTLAYVPQRAFLLDATVSENVAFGVPQELVDLERVSEAVRLARLDECIAALPQGYDEVLGERGSRLSGGQGQRLAIARALYRRASVLILDEATSALDGDAEENIIDMLEALEPRPTLILIAHRMNALRHCDVIHELKEGRIVRSGQHADFAGARVAGSGQVMVFKRAAEMPSERLPLR